MLTRAEILKEYANCLQSPIYAIQTYLKTFDKTQEGFVPFKLFPRQKEILHAYDKYRFNLVTKPRQAGVSTTTAAFMSIKVGFADPKNPEAVLIVANKQELAFEFLAKIKDFLSQLPRWVWGNEYYGTPEKEAKSIYTTDSKKEIRLPNGSRVKAVATSKDALRGFTPTYLVMDEAAYIDNGAEVFGAALTALGTGGKATLISTPNGLDALYYKTYEQSKAKKNNFNIIEMKWYEDLRYNKDLRWRMNHIDAEGRPMESFDEEEEVEFTFASYEARIKSGWKPTSSWYEEMARGMNNNAKMIAQELDVSFIGSGGNVIDERDIEYQETHNVCEPMRVEGKEAETWVWAEPQEDHQYILASDVSRGDGEDSSTIVIIDFTIMEQVMEYQGKIPPDLLAVLVKYWSDRYNAYTVVDITGGMGVATVLKLLELKFKRLHYDTPNGKILSGKQEKIKAKAKDNKVPGLTVNSIRLAMISLFEEKVRSNLLKIRSSRATSEMRTFVYKGGRPDHMDGYHDDLIMALAMALWVLEHSFKKLQRHKDQTKAILNSWGGGPSTQGQPVVDRGFDPKQKTSHSSLPKPKFHPSVAKNMQDPTGQYLWLFSGTK